MSRRVPNQQLTTNNQQPLIWLHWLIVVAIAAAIFFASSLSAEQKPGDPFKGADKIEHFLAYGILAIALFRALAASAPRRSGTFHFILTIAVAALYGATDEIHQHFTPGRSMSILDWRADVIGASVAAAIMYIQTLIGGHDS
jgi:VanZ family protein